MGRPMSSSSLYSLVPGLQQANAFCYICSWGVSYSIYCPGVSRTIAYVDAVVKIGESHQETRIFWLI